MAVGRFVHLGKRARPLFSTGARAQTDAKVPVSASAADAVTGVSKQNRSVADKSEWLRPIHQLMKGKPQRTGDADCGACPVCWRQNTLIA